MYNVDTAANYHLKHSLASENNNKNEQQKLEKRKILARAIQLECRTHKQTPFHNVTKASTQPCWNSIYQMQSWFASTKIK